VCLRHGTVGLGDFTPAALADSELLALARRLSVIADANPNPNAMTPIRVELDLANGNTVACDVAQVLGSPARPLAPEAARAKFGGCGASAALWDAIMSLGSHNEAGGVARRAGRRPTRRKTCRRSIPSSRSRCRSSPLS
jgi:2-methylcitrate dehydratase PrpD